MSKIRVLLVGATAAGAFAAASFIPVHADTTVGPTPIGSASVGGSGPADGHIYLDGAESNPDPGDGYLTITASGVCGNDNGSPAAHTGAENCNAALITSQAP